MLVKTSTRPTLNGSALFKQLDIVIQVYMHWFCVDLEMKGMTVVAMLINFEGFINFGCENYHCS